MAYTNSSLASYTRLAPQSNHYGTRTHSIDTITPHCVAAEWSIEQIGACFANPSRRASCNYGIGKDGRIGIICEEKTASGCSSNRSNDERAITIECSSSSVAPYALRDAVYQSLIRLCIDICKRNGKKRLLWLGSKEKTLAYTPKSDEAVLTAHRWFANKACPGDWLYNRYDDLAERVTELLGASEPKPTVKPEPKPAVKVIKCTGVAKKRNTAYVGSYVTTDDLNIRNDAGVKNAIIGMIPIGGKCHCYGYYTQVGLSRWLYITYTVNGVQYLGFVNAAYLKKS